MDQPESVPFVSFKRFFCPIDAGPKGPISGDLGLTRRAVM